MHFAYLSQEQILLGYLLFTRSGIALGSKENIVPYVMENKQRQTYTYDLNTICNITIMLARVIELK